MKMANKKIVLFIVEGINDKTSLALCMGQLLEGKSVHFEITDGDITTEYGNSSVNIAMKIGNIVKEFSGKIFKRNDFIHVVHIVDMDGAYIPDKNIIQGEEDKNLYTYENIVTSKVQKTIERNQQKRELIDKMISLNKVWRTIPYSVYYFSCNMDHVLHNEANLCREDKNKYATEFENKFFGKTEDFREFFYSEEFAVKGSYGETWQFIKGGTNSLKKYSNFSVYLDMIKEKCENFL